MYKRFFAVWAMVGLVATSFTGCGEPKGTAVLPKPEEDGPPMPKQAFSIKAQEGGAILLNQTDGSRVKIVFPQGSLASDVELEVSERTENGAEILSNGFELNRKGSADGLDLKFPALLIFDLDKETAKDVAIVRYGNGGSFEILPTRVSIKDGKTSLMAQVDHFSNYGTRLVDPQANKQAKQNQKASDFNWVIYVKDSFDVDNGPMKRKITLDFKAMNTSGDIAGQYTGYARAKTTNDMESGGGKLDADFQIADENMTFEVSPYIELASLVPEDDDLPLAKLEPEKEPDFMGYGTLHMSGSGIGTGSAGGYSASRGIKAEDSNDPFTVAVMGPLVRLSVTITGVGTVYFDGYIRGEGK